MAVSLQASGTQSATITTEHTLASVNASGVFRLWVNLVNMAAGDVLELRVKGKVLTSTTKRGIAIYTFQGVQLIDDLIAVSDAFETDLSETDGLEFTLKQTFGTSRNFDWKVTKIG